MSDRKRNCCGDPANGGWLFCSDCGLLRKAIASGVELHLLIHRTIREKTGRRREPMKLSDLEVGTASTVSGANGAELWLKGSRHQSGSTQIPAYAYLVSKKA